MPLKIKNKQVNAKNKILKEFLRYAIVILAAIISATLLEFLYLNLSLFPLLLWSLT